MNDNKTEFLIIKSRWDKKNANTNSNILIGSDRVESAPSARNIGAVIDANLTMSSQVSNVCKTCYIGIRQISKIRHLLTEEDTATLVNALVTSRLDSFNSLLIGIPDYMIFKLQLVQNNAARLIAKKNSTHSPSQILKPGYMLDDFVSCKF